MSERLIPAFAGTTCHHARHARTRTVHPRVRGDHANHEHARAYSVRFIPAFAGTTRMPTSAQRRVSVHPRVRGDHRGAPNRKRTTLGSSPRSRGPLSPGTFTSPAQRFIPAFAGTTRPVLAWYVQTSVHPRVRGDHAVRADVRFMADGSSPRSRGPPLSALASCVCSAVHPRVRGDHDCQSGHFARTNGSSPRSRGPPHCGSGARGGGRFIPAFAGTTGSTSTAAGSAPVHPRVRGDHSSGTRMMNEISGSSPRSRGPRPDRLCAAAPDRFIPAFAGTTATR